MRLLMMELEELQDKMTIYKHVFIQQQNERLSDTFCVGRSAFYSFSTVHKDQKKKTSEYDQEMPQSHTADQDQA